jgi:hypothetical protein
MDSLKDPKTLASTGAVIVSLGAIAYSYQKVNALDKKVDGCIASIAQELPKLNAVVSKRELDLMARELGNQNKKLNLRVEKLEKQLKIQEALMKKLLEHLASGNIDASVIKKMKNKIKNGKKNKDSDSDSGSASSDDSDHSSKKKKKKSKSKNTGVTDADLDDLAND